MSANLQNTKDMEFIYNCTSVSADRKKPIVYRGYGDFSDNGTTTTVSPTIVSSSEYYNVDDFGNREIPFAIEHALPAFGLNYFTNDIKGTVTLMHNGSQQSTDFAPDTTYQPNGLPIVRLLDRTTHTYIIPDGKTALNSSHAAEVNADGSYSFSALNPAHTYQLSFASNNYGYYEVNPINFTEDETNAATVKTTSDTFDQNYAGKLNDVVVNVTFSLNDSPTGVNDVEAAKQVSSVRYYNLQGQQSATAYDGLNVVVTTYTDGTTTTRKVMK